MEQDTLKAILDELKKLTKLTGLSITKESTAEDAMGLLDQIGFSPKEIGETLGKSSNLVNSTLYNIRKKKSDLKTKTKKTSKK